MDYQHLRDNRRVANFPTLSEILVSFRSFSKTITHTHTLKIKGTPRNAVRKHLESRERCFRIKMTEMFSTVPQ